MKKFFVSAMHALLGGFTAGIAAYGGTSQLKAILLAGLGSAVSSVISLWTNRPATKQQ